MAEQSSKNRAAMWLCLVLSLTALHCAGGEPGDADTALPADPPPRSSPSRFNVGFRILRVPRPTGEPLVVALWYPTASPAAEMWYPQAGSHMAADVAPDAPPARGPFPLVIFSHGGGGAAVNGAVFAEELAASGFVVAGPDHADDFVGCRSDSSLPPDPGRALQWLRWAREVSAGRRPASWQHRPRETSATIDALLRESADGGSSLRDLVDADRIGMMGVSFGAWTTLAVAGTIPLYHDARIKAVAPVAGPVGKGAMADRISAVRVPLMLVFGEEETIVLGDTGGPRKTAGMSSQYEAARPPRFLVGIAKARHMDFGGAGTANRTPARAGSVPSSANVRAEDPVIRATNACCLAFFQRYLGGDIAAATRLTSGPSGVFLFKYDLGPDGSSQPSPFLLPPSDVPG